MPKIVNYLKTPTQHTTYYPTTHLAHSISPHYPLSTLYITSLPTQHTLYHLNTHLAHSISPHYPLSTLPISPIPTQHVLYFIRLPTQHTLYDPTTQLSHSILPHYTVRTLYISPLPTSHTTFSPLPTQHTTSHLAHYYKVFRAEKPSLYRSLTLYSTIASPSLQCGADLQRSFSNFYRWVCSLFLVLLDLVSFLRTLCLFYFF